MRIERVIGKSIPSVKRRIGTSYYKERDGQGQFANLPAPATISSFIAHTAIILAKYAIGYSQRRHGYSTFRPDPRLSSTRRNLIPHIGDITGGSPRNNGDGDRKRRPSDLTPVLLLASANKRYKVIRHFTANRFTTSPWPTSSPPLWGWKEQRRRHQLEN
jgi:hypothetical protein